MKNSTARDILTQRKQISLLFFRLIITMDVSSLPYNACGFNMAWSHARKFERTNPRNVDALPRYEIWDLTFWAKTFDYEADPRVKTNSIFK